MNNQNFDLTKFDKVMADVDAVAEAGNFIPDMTTKEGYNASKRFVLDNTMPMRKALEAAHKEVKAPFWDACKFLDGKKKELLTMIEAVEAPHKEAYKNHDAEIKRKKEEKAKALQSKFDELDQFIVYCSTPDVNSESVQSVIDNCHDVDVDPDFFGSRLDSYIEKLNRTIEQLSTLLTQKIQFEQMRKQQEEMEAKQREIERQQREIEEQKRKAEFEAQQKQREIERAEAEKKHKEEMKALAEKQELERDEAERLAKERAEKEAAEAREAEKRAELERIEAEKAARESRTKNRNKAALQIAEKANVSKEQAVLICNAIASGEILFIRSEF